MPCPLENCYQYNAVVSPITARDGAPPSNARRVEYQSFNSHLLNHQNSTWFNGPASQKHKYMIVAFLQQMLCELQHMD